MRTAAKCPLVFEYLDLSTFLKAYYQYRKSGTTGFSYEKWVDELNINLSRVFLRLAVLGLKKVPAKFVEAFSEKSLMTVREKNYFQLLVKQASATTHEERQMYLQRMIQILKTDMQFTEINNIPDFISSPLVPRLLTLLSFRDIHCNLTTISSLLGIELDESKVAVEKLESLKLIEPHNEGEQVFWRACHSKNRVTNHPGDTKLLLFHERSLADAIKAFDQPKNLRRYRSLLLALTEAELLNFYKNLDDFVTEQIAYFGSDFYQGKRLFQFNMNIHPVTQEVHSDKTQDL